MEKGYNQDDFVEFIVSHNLEKEGTDALDINNYTFDELSTLVLMFQEQN